ncbi:uncharacterized protein LOC134980365 isoform X3 [Pseudophryne corroboree]|uniref:uncharacterized protein LOC134980365 isoform X3 n=1 Tax=Pseudophryne corroboree TaxID=495146 RepID=UPI003081E7C0
MAKGKKARTMSYSEAKDHYLTHCDLCQIPKGICRGAIHKYMQDKQIFLKDATDDFVTLEEKIHALREAEPMIGLEYITQYARDAKGFFIYKCDLCSNFFKCYQSVNHVVGTNHRLLYLKTKGFGQQNILFKNLAQYREFIKRCKFAEKFWGRNKITVVDYLAPLAATAGDGHSPTFLELKAAHEAKLKTAQDSGGSITVEVPKCDVDSFSCNEELFEFLGTFSVESERDVPFVMKVSDIFTKSLEQHNRLKELKRLVFANRKKMQEFKKASRTLPTREPRESRRPVVDHSRSRSSSRRDSGETHRDSRYKNQSGYGKRNPGAAGGKKGKKGAANKNKKRTNYGTENPAVIRMLQQLDAFKAKQIKQGPAIKQRGSGAKKLRAAANKNKKQSGFGRASPGAADGGQPGKRGPDNENRRQSGNETENPGAADGGQPGKRGPDNENRKQSGNETENPGAAAGAQEGEQGAADQPKNPADYGTENPAVIRMLQQLETVNSQLGRRGPANKPNNRRGSGARDPEGRGSRYNQDQENPGPSFHDPTQPTGAGKRKGSPDHQPEDQWPSKVHARGGSSPPRDPGDGRRDLPADSPTDTGLTTL